MFKLKRREKPADKSRARIHTPREALVPSFEGGYVYVECLHESTKKVLVGRMGFVEMDKPPVAFKASKKVSKPKPKPKASKPRAAKPKPK